MSEALEQVFFFFFWLRVSAGPDYPKQISLISILTCGAHVSQSMAELACLTYSMANSARAMIVDESG